MSHLDAHQHVHLLPALLPVVLRVAARFDVTALRAARRIRPLRGARSLLLSLFARRGAKIARRAGLRTADTFVGLADTGQLDETSLLRLIHDLPEGTSELVCHPGAGDVHIGTQYDWGFGWDGETEALVSPRARAALVAENIALVSWRDL